MADRFVSNSQAAEDPMSQHNAADAASAKTEAATGPKRPREQRPPWVMELKRFEKPSRLRAAWQLIDTAVPYLALIVLMYLTMQWGWTYWITIGLAIPAGGFLIRLFILFHDCCHGSYLGSQRAMRIVGTIIGIVTFTPFADWRHAHGVHHSTSGNLDRRGIGDVWTMTVAEYAASNKLVRFAYRAFRNPIIMFGLGPMIMFIFVQRFPLRPATWKRVRSVIFTDLMIAAIVVACVLTVGIETYLLILIPPFLFAGSAGIWLFYVQHQFDPSYWERAEEWQSLASALEGSSYYKLPKILQWFSGNIGLHHVHHLRPRIPNYNLQRCLDAIPELRLVNPLTLRRSWKSVNLNIWDESTKQLVSFRALRRILRERPNIAAT